VFNVNATKAKNWEGGSLSPFVQSSASGEGKWRRMLRKEGGKGILLLSHFTGAPSAVTGVYGNRMVPVSTWAHSQARPVPVGQMGG